ISFDRIRGRVEQEFKFENQRTAVRRYLDRLRENVAVDINEQRLSGFTLDEANAQASLSKTPIG
ncbi:MAG: hypothetical protein HYW57_05695, partial [Ignavibacteriales bacterium]|nr:hypothetical protein [Ignavibacteriales bacterium]